MVSDLMKNLYKLFIFFIVVFTATATDIVIFKDLEDSSSFFETVSDYSNYYSTSVLEISEKKDIISALNTYSPKIVIFRSDKIEKMFTHMKSTIDLNIPLVSVNSSLKNDTINTIYINPIVSPEVAITGLSQFTGETITSLGYLYSSSNKKIIKNEINRIDNNYLKIIEREVSDDVSDDEIIYGINKLANSGISNFRIADSGPILDKISSSKNVSEYFEKYVSSIISSSEVFSDSKYKSTPIIKIKENINLVAATTALIATYRVKIGKNDSLNFYNVNSTIATVSIGNVKTYVLNQSHNEFLNFIENDIKSFESSDSIGWTSLKKIPFINQKINSKNKNSIDVSEAVIGGVSTVFNSKFYDVLSNFLIFIIILFSPIIYIIIKMKRKKYSSRKVLLFKSDLEKTKIEVGDSEIFLKKILKKEHLNAILIDTIEELQKKLRKTMPDIFIVDWNVGRDSLKLIKNKIKNHKLSSAETVIIVNAPKNINNSSEVYFSNAEVYIFENLPDKYDLVDIFNGNYSGSSKLEKSEFISGNISGDTLPEIFQLLENGGKNGALIIEDSSPMVVIYYKNGKIIFAEDRFGNKGETAIFNALDCKKGTYSFMLNRVAPAESFSFGAMEILLELAAASDAQSRV
jgi:hypothetical protein